MKVIFCALLAITWLPSSTTGNQQIFNRGLLQSENSTQNESTADSNLGSQVFATQLDLQTQSVDEEGMTPLLEMGGAQFFGDTQNDNTQDDEYVETDNTIDEDLENQTLITQPPQQMPVPVTVQAIEFQEIRQEECNYLNIDEQCKEQVGAVYDEIFGGELAAPERFPYMVSLQIQKDDSSVCFVHFCGATIIAPDIILTAAHCIQEVAPVNTKAGQTIVPVFAALAPTCRHLESSIIGAPGRVKVKYYKLHPNYSRRTLENDIALLKLEKPLSQNGPFARYKAEADVSMTGLINTHQATVSAISLSGILETNRDTLSVLGYGDTDVSESNNKEYNVRYLRRARLNYIPDNQCDNMLDETSAIRELMPDKMLCAFNSSADACGGDSGGPLIITGVGQGLGEKETFEFDYQIGIVSWGPGEACSNLNKQFIGVYTELNGYIDWIDATIQDFSVLGAASFEVAAQPTETSDLGGSCGTKNGCKCKQFWKYQGRSFSNCDNPDNDSGGAWCMVDLGGCSKRPSGSVSLTGEFWDRCNCTEQETKDSDQIQGCPSTRLGCDCRADWSHSGKDYQGCANPDSDPDGDWCYIQGDFNQCQNSAGINTAGRIITSESTGDIIGYFDYCKKECNK